MSTEKLLVGIRDVPEDFPKREAQYRARVVPERQLAVDPFAPALAWMSAKKQRDVAGRSRAELYRREFIRSKCRNFQSTRLGHLSAG